MGSRSGERQSHLKSVIVNDKMQRGYRYDTHRAGGAQGFDPEVRAETDAAEMLALGIFGGKYMTDCRKEFPARWFSRARLASRVTIIRSIIRRRC